MPASLRAAQSISSLISPARQRGLATFILNPGATDPPVQTDDDADADVDEPEAVRAEMQAAVLAELQRAVAKSTSPLGKSTGRGTDSTAAGVDEVTLNHDAAHARCMDSAGAPRVAHSSAFAWDHAQPAAGTRLPSTHLLDASRRAGVCGDFFSGPAGFEGVEAAAMSALALAEALLPTLSSVDRRE